MVEVVKPYIGSEKKPDLEGHSAMYLERVICLHSTSE